MDFKELTKGVLTAVKDATIESAKTNGKELAKEAIMIGSSLAVSSVATKMMSGDSQIAQITGQTMQKMGERHFGDPHQNYTQQEPEHFGQINAEQHQEKIDYVEMLDNLDKSFEQKPSMPTIKMG